VSEDALDIFLPEPEPATRDRSTGVLIWSLQRGERTLRCELRHNPPSDREWEVCIFEDDWLSSAQRCALEASARFLALEIKRDRLAQGWREHGAPVVNRW
jgi:hypothetical protein